MTVATSSEELFPTILPWIGALVALLVIGVTVIWWIRRSFSGTADTPSEDFTLHDLRQMHNAGELSDEEFERTREAMITRVRESVRDKPEQSADTD